MTGAVLLAFSSKRDSLLSWFIRRVQRWRHSHVAMVAPDMRSFAESTGDKWLDSQLRMRDGVRVGPISELASRDDLEIRVLEHPNPMGAWNAVGRYLWMGYDRIYLWSAFWGGGRQDKTKMTCTELIRQCCIDAGYDPLPPSVKIPTVRDFYIISKEYKPDAGL